MTIQNFIISIIFIIGQANSDSRLYKTKHFKIFYTSLDDKSIDKIADSLEQNYKRIITDLKSRDIPRVTVHFYADTAKFHKDVPGLPSWATGLSTSVSEIKILSPNYDRQDYRNTIKNTIHEFAHCVSWRINKAIDNNPRWLWESIAIYESNQSLDPHRLSYLINQKPPSLQDLNQFTNTYIYDVGYFIADFLVNYKGFDILNTLIKNNGNLKQTLNMDDEEFTKQWFDFVKKKYGI